MSVMFSDESDGGSAPRDAGRRRPSPRGVEILAAHARAPGEPGRPARRCNRALRGAAARRCARSPSSRARPLAASPSLRPVAASSLTGPIGPHRRWSWARRAAVATSRRVRAGARRHGQRRRADASSPTASASCCESRGEHVADDRVVRTMVPVSVRRRGEKGVYNNRVSAVFAGLPVGLDDPAARLAQHPRRDGRRQGVQAGRRRRRAQLAVGLRAAAAARARQPRS